MSYRLRVSMAIVAVLAGGQAIVSGQDDLKEEELAVWEQPLTIMFDGTTWVDAIEAVANELQRPIVIPAILHESKERDPDYRMQANFVRTPAGVILQEVLSVQSLHWRLSGNDITIADGYDERLVRRTYDLTRFVDRGWVLHFYPPDEPEAESKPADTFFGWAPPKDCQSVPTLEEYLLRNSGGEWLKSDLLGGWIHAEANSLEVVNNLNTHGEIRRLLSQLDEMYAGKHRKAGFALFDEPGDVAVKTALNRPITIQCENVPFPQVLIALEQAAGVPIRVDEDQLKDAGLEQLMDKEVSLIASDVVLKDALRELLVPLDLSYMVYLGQCYILCPDIYCPIELPWLYDVTDLSEENRETLVQFLHEEIDGAWECFDGIGGWAALLPGDILFVCQTERSQHKIQKLLKELRHSAK